MTEKKPPPSDLYANPQDTEFGRAAADDQERADETDAPGTDTTGKKPRAGGKAEPAD